MGDSVFAEGSREFVDGCGSVPARDGPLDGEVNGVIESASNHGIPSIKKIMVKTMTELRDWLLPMLMNGQVNAIHE